MHLAEKHHCTLLMQRHLNKQSGGRSLYRGLGSIAFMAACRCAVLVARDPLMPGQCVLASVRSSLTALPPSLAYRISAADGALPTLDWLGPSPFTADELLAGMGRGPRDQAVIFLEQFLAAGPRSSRDIWQAAQKVGLSARTLQRAKRGLDIRCRRTYRDGRPVSYWLLRGQELPAALADPADLSPWLAVLEKQFPPPTPLDEDDRDGGSR